MHLFHNFFLETFGSTCSIYGTCVVHTYYVPYCFIDQCYGTCVYTYYVPTIVLSTNASAIRQCLLIKQHVAMESHIK